MRPIDNICWNLFLALVPVALGLLLGYLSWRDKSFNKRWYIWAPLLLLWLGFLPNTCYLLTEWRHFVEDITNNPEQTRHAVHDKKALLEFLALTTFYVVYSALGLLTFSMAIWPVAQWLQPPNIARFGFFMLCALGVYLGLVKRLNTWDIWRDPANVAISAIDALIHPFTLVLIICFALVIWLNFWVFEIFIDGVMLRVRRMRAAS